MTVESRGYPDIGCLIKKGSIMETWSFFWLFFAALFIGIFVYRLATRTKRKAEKAYRQKREKEELNESFRRGVMNSDFHQNVRDMVRDIHGRKH